MNKLIIKLFIVSLVMAGQGIALAKDVNFNLLGSTPVGSWQVREDIQTSHKGKQSLTVIRSSMLSSEDRNGEKHYWIEMAIESFKVKKNGSRKKAGDKVVMKSLVPASTFTLDPANVMGNLRAFGVETIIQSGKDEPMRISDGGDMMAGAMSAMQTEIAYDFAELGSERVAVPAGEFNSTKVQGSGTVDMKIIFKKIHIESDTTMWLSDKVPFGTVKLQGTSTMNGKKSTSHSELIEYGMSGAVSEITKEPIDMPKMPNIFGG